MDTFLNYLTVTQVKILICLSVGLLLCSIFVLYLYWDSAKNNPSYVIFGGIIIILICWYTGGMGVVHLAGIRNYHDPIFKELVGVDPPATQRKKDRDEWFELHRNALDAKRAYHLQELEKAKRTDGTHQLRKALDNYEDFERYLGYYKDK